MSQKPPDGGAAKVDWHRLFGLLLTDYFTGSPYEVETEKDLSLHQQFLDVVIVRKTEGTFKGRLPDGLDDLAAHNLISFKSHQEALDDWALKELTGHYVNYRKQLSGRGEPLLPEDQFRLYAVCCRDPHNLAQLVPLQTVGEGVYDYQRGTDRVRVIVVSQLPKGEQNAPLHLFSASGEKVEFGATHYRPRSETTSTVLLQLFQGYQLEGLPVPYTLEEFYRDWIETHKGELLERIPPEQRVEGLTAEQRTAGVPTEELERLLEQRRAADASTKPKKGDKPGRGSPKRGAK